MWKPVTQSACTKTYGRCLAGALLFIVSVVTVQKTLAYTRVDTARTGIAHDHARLVLESATAIQYKVTQSQDLRHVVLSLQNADQHSTLEGINTKITADHPYFEPIRINRHRGNEVDLSINLKQPAIPKLFTLQPQNGFNHRLVIDFYPRNHHSSQSAHPASTETPQKNRKDDDTQSPQPVSPQPSSPDFNAYAAQGRIGGGTHTKRRPWQLRSELPSTLQELWLEVFINQQSHGSVRLLKSDQEGVLVRRSDLKDWRFKLPDTGTVTYRNEEYYPLTDLAGLRYKVNNATQSIAITAPPQLFITTVSRGRTSQPPAPPQRSPLGGFFNYDLSATHASGDTRFSSVFELGFFNRMGVGVSRFLWNEDPNGQQQFTRLETTWTHDRPEQLATLRVGDSISGRGAWARSVRFGGIQWATNFATQPSLVTFPLPTANGEAVLPSSLELYVDNVLRARREVPAGPFTLQDLPVVTGSGQARIVIRDLLGREQIISLPYYTSSRLLREGLHEYSYEAGVIRENFGTKSNDYGRAAAVGTHRYGFSNNVTGEIRAEVLEEQQTLGLSTTALWSDIGVFSASIAASRGERGRGGLLGFGYEYQGHTFNLGANTQIASRGFNQVGLEPERLAPIQITRAFASYSISGHGSVNVNYSHQRFRDRDDQELISASYNTNVGRQGFLSLSAFHFFSGDQDTIISLNFTLPFGKRSTSSLNLEHQDDRLTTTAQLQRSLPAGSGYGYRLLASEGTRDRLEATGSLRTQYGTYSVDVSHTGGNTGVRASARGGLATAGGEVFFSRHIDRSFAVVNLDGHDDVRIYADNQEVARTNKDGKALVPDLRAYETNRLRIEQADLPLATQLRTTEMAVVPYFRSGLYVDFPLEQVSGALIKVVLENGDSLPPGAEVRIVGEDDVYPVGLHGNVYPTKLKNINVLRASWNGKTCEFELEFPPTDHPLPNLGTFTCIGVASQ